MDNIIKDLVKVVGELTLVIQNLQEYNKTTLVKQPSEKNNIDLNGIERLTDESDDQYLQRTTRPYTHNKEYKYHAETGFIITQIKLPRRRKSCYVIYGKDYDQSGSISPLTNIDKVYADATELDYVLNTLYS